MDKKFTEIVDRVLHLYIKCGVKSITMDDVAHELSISKKTLYLYVKDKADLVDKVIEYQLGQHRCEIANIDTNNINAIDVLIRASKFVCTQFKNMNSSVSYDLQKYYPASWNKIVEYRSTHIYEHIRNNMQQGIQQGLYRDDLNIDIISHLYVMKMEEVFLRPPENDILAKYTSEEIFNTMFHYHIRAIANKKGIEYYENKIKTE